MNMNELFFWTHVHLPTSSSPSSELLDCDLERLFDLDLDLLRDLDLDLLRDLDLDMLRDLDLDLDFDCLDPDLKNAIKVWSDKKNKRTKLIATIV